MFTVLIYDVVLRLLTEKIQVKQKRQEAQVQSIFFLFSFVDRDFILTTH